VLITPRVIRDRPAHYSDLAESLKRQLAYILESWYILFVALSVN
jgi:hypothetical protein